MLRPIALSLFVAAVACADGLASEDVTASEPVAAAAPAAAPVVPAAPAPAARPDAAVTGRITFEGEAPAPQPIDMASDPFCAGAHEGGMTFATIQVGEGGGLRDVFVQLTGVPDERYEAPETPVELDQVGCTYVPHVFGVMKKQPIKIINSDETLHNIHAVPRENKEFNKGMPTKGLVIEEEFKKAEEAIPIKCDVHAWMKCYAFCMEHPYFAVTAADGSFTIDAAGLPDGEYGLKAWHEELGVREGKVTVKDGQASADIAFARE